MELVLQRSNYTQACTGIEIMDSQSAGSACFPGLSHFVPPHDLMQIPPDRSVSTGIPRADLAIVWDMFRARAVRAARAQLWYYELCPGH